MDRAVTTPIWTPIERLQLEDLAQAAAVEAVFVYNAAMRNQMLPRKTFPRPELEGQRQAPLQGVMPGVEIQDKGARQNATETPNQNKN